MPTTMKKYSIELEIAVRNPKRVIQKARQSCASSTWKLEVKESNGDELHAAVFLLLGSHAIVPDDLRDAIDFLSSGCKQDGEIHLDWETRRL
jgi:hypothetical protein